MKTTRWIAVFSIAAVVVLTLLEWRQRGDSPGPLSRIHSQVPELVGPDGCVHCHLAPSSESQSSTAWHWQPCLKCHAEIADQLADSTGLHGKQSINGKNCAACHPEHLTSATQLVSETSFKRAGFSSVAQFTHSSPNFPLHGLHPLKECKRCHTNAETIDLIPGQKRFLGLNAECASCHEDPHNDALGRECSTCHGQEAPFAAAANFTHEALPLTGSHAALECSICHTEPPTFSSKPSRNCADCHDNPHQAGGTEMAIASASDCARCHSSTTFSVASFGVLEHSLVGVLLTGKHQTAACSSCHGGHIQPSSESTFLRRDMNDCNACHQNVHSPNTPGTLPVRPQLGRKSPSQFQSAKNCADCHSTSAFLPALARSDQHERFCGALEGLHAEQPCSSCHADGVRSTPLAQHTLPQTIGSTLAQCDACHTSPHRENFLAGLSNSTCVHCHDAAHANFLTPLARLNALDHSATGFDLAGAHADVPCSSCHSGGSTFAERYPSRNGESCQECHESPHRVSFAGGKFAEVPCGNCHGHTQWTPHHFGPRLHAGTSFPLHGAHAAVPCKNCHTGEPQLDR